MVVQTTWTETQITGSPSQTGWSVMQTARLMKQFLATKQQLLSLVRQTAGQIQQRIPLTFRNHLFIFQRNLVAERERKPPNQCSRHVQQSLFTDRYRK